MGDNSTVPARTPAKTPSTAKKSASALSSTGKQQSILGFFSKSTPQSQSKVTGGTQASRPTPSRDCLKETTTKSNALSFSKRPSSTITPVPSSDALEPLSSQENRDAMQVDSKVLSSDSLPSPGGSPDVDVPKPTANSSPSRKVRGPRPRVPRYHLLRQC